VSLKQPSSKKVAEDHFEEGDETCCTDPKKRGGRKKNLDQQKQCGQVVRAAPLIANGTLTPTAKVG